MQITKRQAQLQALIEKETVQRADRLAALTARLEKEQSKVKEVTVEDEGVSDLLSMISNTAEKNGVSVQKLMDFAAKKLIGETAKVMYRRKREPKEPKEIKEPAAKKTTAKKK